MDHLDDARDVEMEEAEGDTQEQDPTVIYIDDYPVPPLDPTKVYIHRHPHSRFNARTPQTTTPPQTELPNKPPYWPYKTYEDFEVAELCLDAGLSTGNISKLVKLIHRIKENPECFTLKNAREVMETADEDTLFNEAMVSIVAFSFPHPKLMFPSFGSVL